jgi:8-oxo-dGTP pyrophosphatase MutT (NUDIX family)
MNDRTALSERVRELLAGLEARTLPGEFIHDAAVLMPIFERGGAAHFLLTRRTEEVPTHKGQISFPGGRRHAGEDLAETALRETFEEVGIPRKSIEVLGRYHEYVSSSDYRVVPFAGYIAAPFEVVPQVREVAEVVEVPFGVFLDPERIRVEKKLWRGDWVSVPYVRFGALEVWGLTARIILDFLADLQGFA